MAHPFGKRYGAPRRVGPGQRPAKRLCSFHMPSVKISSQTPLSAQECYKRVSEMLANDGDLKKLDPKYACQFDEKTLSGRAEGSQFKATLKVSPQGPGSEVEIVVELPFHLALVKGLVQKTLEKKLNSALG